MTVMDAACSLGGYPLMGRFRPLRVLRVYYPVENSRCAVVLITKHREALFTVSDVQRAQGQLCALLPDDSACAVRVVAGRHSHCGTHNDPIAACEPTELSFILVRFTLWSGFFSFRACPKTSSSTASTTVPALLPPVLRCCCSINACRSVLAVGVPDHCQLPWCVLWRFSCCRCHRSDWGCAGVCRCHVARQGFVVLVLCCSHSFVPVCFAAYAVNQVSRLPPLLVSSSLVSCDSSMPSSSCRS